jgi:two-component system phosphate regulon response regulator PhoB
LRIQAVLRRHPLEAEPPTAPSKSPSPSTISGGLAGEADQLLNGDLRVDRATHRVFVESREVKLTALEFRLLWTLTSAHGRVLTRTDLLNQAWKTWNTTSGITTRTVDTHIKRLREKIGRAGERIETVRGVGYRFVPETEAP